MKKGFTLIEVLVAIFVLTVGAGGVFTLIHQVVQFSTGVTHQLEATFLSQEGIEIVRNIRDSNFLKIHKGQDVLWTDGLLGCETETGCEADYTSSLLILSQSRYLQLANGFYGYTAGTLTLFRRIITIIPIDADTISVEVVVSWKDKDTDRSIETATKLYNWLVPAL